MVNGKMGTKVVRDLTPLQINKVKNLNIYGFPITHVYLLLISYTKNKSFYIKYKI